MFILAITASLALLVQTSGAPQAFRNGDFEQGAVGEMPDGWRVPTPDYAAQILETGARDGGRCVCLSRNDTPKSSPFGNLMQSFDATPWRGKPIRVRAWVRVDGESAHAQMWARVDRESLAPGMFDNMGDRPVRAGDWSVCEITGVVDADASRLNIGVMLFGEGELYVDAVELETSNHVEVARALTVKGLENLVAFARLFGYVRHFHPSDEAAGADWERIAVQGVRAIEGADSAAALAASLQAQFAALAPTVRVFVEGSTPEPAHELAQPPSGAELTYWEHDGFGQHVKGNSVYRSQRVRIASVAELPAEVPAPAHPYAADLGRGVACLVPLALYRDDQGSLPRALPVAVEASAPARASCDDRATRLASVIIAWNIFQHFYPYFDVIEADWNAELENALRSAATDTDERVFLGTLSRLVAALEDGHGHVMSRSSMRMGMLPLEWAWIEGALVVTAVAEDLLPRPAPGDIVLSIDGIPVEAALERAEASISGATPQWIRVRALDDLRLRESPAPCRLQLATYPDDAPASVEVAARNGVADIKTSLPPMVSEIEEGVWYIDLDRASDADLRAIVDQLADAKGVLFDLRGYPRRMSPETIFGHLIEEPVASAQWHIPLVRRPNREQLSFERGGEWLLQPEEPYFRAKKAFLTGGGAISYAESCMGIVEHYRLAEIVGGPTAGTNGNVNPFELPGGFRISWTGMKVLKQDGSRHHGVGIQPTVAVERTRKGAAEGRDEILERALALVGE